MARVTSAVHCLGMLPVHSFVDTSVDDIPLVNCRLNIEFLNVNFDPYVLSLSFLGQV